MNNNDLILRINQGDMLVRVTPEEMKILVDIRRIKAARENNERIVAEVLNTAARWYKMGGGNYLHFREQFGENSVGLNQPDFFEIVERVTDCALEFVMEGV
jgi:hypothetical protein